MKVAFITNVPSPYRVDFFNEWGKYCDLTVFFEKKSSDERDKTWEIYDFKNFTGIFLKGIKTGTDKAFSLGVCRCISEGSYDHIVLANTGTPTGVLAVLYMKCRRISYWIEGDGGFAKNGRGLKEKLKKILMSSAKGCFSTSYEHDKYYMTYGVRREKIFRYPFTALYEKDIRERIFSLEEKSEVRKKLEIPEERYILAVGQFIYRKGFDLLLHAAARLPQDVGIYFIGGKPTAEYTALKETHGLKNVHFIPFLKKDMLRKWYSGAELMVLPTREDIWGLVVNEAMAVGLPVVTTERCIAGLELIKEGENGFIVPVDDVDCLAEKINIILQNSDLRHTMSLNSLNVIRDYTIEKMVQKHMEVLQKIESV